MSALARVQYDYSGKYLLSAALRADGSSRFGPTNRWGYFPSASVGWNILRESFMKDPKIISNLKLRGSYGVTGNFQIGNYASQSIISSSNYVFGPQGGTALASGLYQSTAGNPKLGWEKTSAINLGFEIGVLKDQYNLIVDVYNNNTKDLLLNVPVPQSTGFSTNLVNIGKVNNKGFELTFNTNNQIGKFHLTTNTNFSQNWNKVIDLGGANSIITQAQGVIYFITQVGKPIGNYYTLVQTGIFKDQTDVDTTAVKAPGVKPGDMKFKDVNGDGKIDVTNDRAITGNYMPKFTYGFSAQLTYKIIDLSVAFQGIYGSTIANINQRHMNIPESFSNGTADLLNRWQSPSNPGNGIVPRANRSQTGYNATISTYHLAEGSYVRVRDITIGVTIPQSICKKAGIVNARFYASAQNPFTITKYKGYNPEVSIDPNPLTPGIDYGTYPLTKTIFFGLNLNF
jgi:TonB-linked SusC/RagA family outer membrane protein